MPTVAVCSVPFRIAGSLCVVCGRSYWSLGQRKRYPFRRNVPAADRNHSKLLAIYHVCSRRADGGDSPIRGLEHRLTVGIVGQGRWLDFPHQSGELLGSRGLCEFHGNLGRDRRNIEQPRLRIEGSSCPVCPTPPSRQVEGPAKC